MKAFKESGVVTVLAAMALLPAATLAEPLRAAVGEWGIDTTGLSSTVRPGDDFYRFVNEGWLTQAKIPQGLPATDALTELYLSTEQRVLGIITEAREGNDAPGTPEQLIADYYRSFADRERRNALGLTPIAASLGLLMGANTHSDLARAMGFTWTAGVMAAGIESDPNDPRRQIPSVVQSGLTLPSRDYYLESGEPYEGVRTALRDYIASTFRRAGLADADARAAKVIALETELARRHWTQTEMRDVVRQNRMMTLASQAWATPCCPVAQAGQSDPSLEISLGAPRESAAASAYLDFAAAGAAAGGTGKPRLRISAAMRASRPRNAR